MHDEQKKNRKKKWWDTASGLGGQKVDYAPRRMMAMDQENVWKRFSKVQSIGLSLN